MPEETCGNRTKYQLDRALKELLKQKPLSQMRVRELTEQCGIRRQSFYYHFSDVYDLFNWSVCRERESLPRRQEECLTWQQVLGDLLDHTETDRPYYQAILENRGRTGLEEVFHDAISQLMEKTLTYYRERCGVPPDAETERRHRASGETLLLALLERWICGDLKQSREEVIAMLEESVHQSAIGAVWQNLPYWGKWN